MVVARYFKPGMPNTGAGETGLALAPGERRWNACSPMSVSETVLVANTRQAGKTRMLTVSFGALAVAACTWAVSGALAGAADPTACILAPLGLAVAWGMGLYSRRYVVSMRMTGDVIVLRTAAFGARDLSIPLERIGRRTFHEGRYPDSPSMRAPWLTLHIDGFRVPFLIDMQAERVDLQRIQRLR